MTLWQVCDRDHLKVFAARRSQMKQKTFREAEQYGQCLNRIVNVSDKAD